MRREEMESALRKLLGPDLESIEIKPAFAGGGDLHIAECVFKKGAGALRLALGENGIQAVGVRQRADGTTSGKIHFHASELAAAASKKPTPHA